MAEQRSKIKGPGEHVDQEVNIEPTTALAARHAPLESGPDRMPARYQHLFPNHSREDGIERHIRDESWKRFAEGSGKAGEQRPHRGLQILAQGACIRGGLSSQLCDDRIRNQMAFARPTAI